MADKPTVQDVLRQFYPGYLEKYTPNAGQAKAAVHILNCRTGAYGVNVSRCGQCGHIQIHNNSCRDRSCPMCQALSNELWVDAQIGRYTHRIAVSNSRILRMDETTVTIKVKDYKDGGQWKELALDGVEFVRRFLMHVPPKGFVRIRHYGILSNQNKRKLIPICRNLIGCREFLRRFKKGDKVQAVRFLYKKDVTVCPCCDGAMSYEVCTEWTPKRSSA